MAAVPPVPSPDPQRGDDLAAADIGAVYDNLREILVVQTSLQNTVQSQATTLAAQVATIAAQGTSISNLQQLVNAAGSPPPPTGLALISATTQTLTISWNPVPGSNITYSVEWSPIVGGAWTPLGATAATTATISGLVASTAYNVRVHTMAGTLSGPVGTPVQFTTSTAIAAPLAPTLMLVGTPATTSISVSWNSVANATTYELGYLITGTWTSIITTASTAATLTALTASTAYTIQVRGDNGAVTGALSAGLVVTTASAGSAPAQVTGGVASAATANSLTFTWTSLGSTGSPPATDPGLAVPSLSIAPSAAYTFQNIAYANTAQAGNAGTQSLNFYTSAGGTMTVTLIGTTTMRAGASGTSYIGLQGVWADLIATAATAAYHAPAVAGSDTVTVEMYVAGSGTPQTGVIAVTITAGATVETGGYNPTGGYTYVPSISSDGGTTWVASPAQSAVTITFGGLIASHSYKMRVHGVSQAGVAGIESAISTLSTTAPGPSIIGDPTGFTAARAADYVSSWGPNIYPLNNQDGGIGAPGSELAGQFNYIFGGTGHWPLARVYTTPGNGPQFVTALQALINSNNIIAVVTTDTFATSDPSGAAYVVTHLPPSHVIAEGLNEPAKGPNTPPGGFGPYSQAVILAAQTSLWNAAHPLGIKVYGPTVLFTCQDQINFWNVTGQLAAFLAVTDGISSHLYPGWGCYSAQNMLIDWTNTSGLGNKPVAITEFDYAIYNFQGSSYPQANYEAVTGWAELCFWANGYFQRNVRVFNHWSMNDFTNEGFFPVGLFVNSAATPHRYTTQIAAFIKLLTDNSANARTFTPGKINVTVSGLPTGSWAGSGGQLDWLQIGGAGDFFGLLRNEQNTFSGATSQVTLTFGTLSSLVEDYGITGTDGSQNSKTPAPRSRWTDLPANQPIQITLGTEFRVIRVRKPP